MVERDAEGVLARWSRRKAAARAGAPEPVALPAKDVRPAREGAPPGHAPAVDPPVVPDPPPELPDPDTLDAASDFKVFMQQGVPPDLRRRALRRLWRLDPAYSFHDGLDDCCGDFTDQARVVQGLRTAYRVGRGFLEELATPDQAGPPATAEPARAPSAPAAAAAAASVDDAAEQQDTAGLPSAVVAGAPADDRPDGASRSREREQGRPRPLPRRS